MLKPYTFKTWREDHTVQPLLRVHLGYWYELDRWPSLGEWFQWSGWIPDLWYYLKCRWWRKYNHIEIESLPPTWSDTEDLMLHGMFQLLRNVVEKEHVLVNIAPEGDPTDGKSWAWALDEIMALYTWWMYKRPAREIEYDRRLSEWSEERFTDGPYGPKWDALRELDDRRDVEDEEMLHRLIKVRQYLWT